MAANSFPCPACGFVTFPEAFGSYAICDVCGWKNDPVQLAHPLLKVGANSESLVEAQSEVVKRYPLEMQSFNNYQRDPEWRPLTDDEARAREGAPRSINNYLHSACNTEPPYYWRQPR